MAAEKFGMYDLRRVEMAREGFVVRQIHVDRESHQVVSVWYVFDPTDGAREADDAKKASYDEPHANSTISRNAVRGIWE